MAQENVEIVRTVLDMFTRRDHEAVFEFYDPDIEWDASRPGGCNGVDTAGIYRGHDGVRA
jgi:ketosteroid isomerase-like protein